MQGEARREEWRPTKGRGLLFSSIFFIVFHFPFAVCHLSVSSSHQFSFVIGVAASRGLSFGGSEGNKRSQIIENDKRQIENDK